MHRRCRHTSYFLTSRRGKLRRVEGYYIPCSAVHPGRRVNPAGDATLFPTRHLCKTLFNLSRVQTARKARPRTKFLSSFVLVHLKEAEEYKKRHRWCVRCFSSIASRKKERATVLKPSCWRALSAKIRSRLFTAPSKSNWCPLIESGHFEPISSLDFWQRLHPLSSTTQEDLRRATLCYGYERCWGDFWKAATPPSPFLARKNNPRATLERTLGNVQQRFVFFFFFFTTQAESARFLWNFPRRRSRGDICRGTRARDRSAIDSAANSASGWITPRVAIICRRVWRAVTMSPTIVAIWLQRCINTASPLRRVFNSLN